eukprot:2121718-Rhodomonas_salina.2
MAWWIATLSGGALKGSQAIGPEHSDSTSHLNSAKKPEKIRRGGAFSVQVWLEMIASKWTTGHGSARSGILNRNTGRSARIPQADRSRYTVYLDADPSGHCSSWYARGAVVGQLWAAGAAPGSSAPVLCSGVAAPRAAFPALDGARLEHASDVAHA